MTVVKKIIAKLRLFIGWLPPSVVPLLVPGVLAVASKVGLSVSADVAQQIILSVIVAIGTHAVANTTNQ